MLGFIRCDNGAQLSQTIAVDHRIRQYILHVTPGLPKRNGLNPHIVGQCAFRGPQPLPYPRRAGVLSGRGEDSISIALVLLLVQITASLVDVGVSVSECVLWWGTV